MGGSGPLWGTWSGCDRGGGVGLRRGGSTGDRLHGAVPLLLGQPHMEVTLRHLPRCHHPPDSGGRLDQLLSLSMAWAWANCLFLGCSDNKDLLEKVMEMVGGVEVGDLPQFTTRVKEWKNIKAKAEDSSHLHYQLQAGREAERNVTLIAEALLRPLLLPTHRKEAVWMEVAC